MNWKTLLPAALVCASLAKGQLAPGGVGGLGGNGGVGVLDEDRERNGGRMMWRPWLRAIGYYNDYIHLLDGTDVVTSKDNFGAQGLWGISGWKATRKTTFLGGYSGSQAVVFTGNGLSGMSNVGFVGASHQVNRELSFSGQQLLGDTLGGYGLGAGFVGLGGGFSGLMQGQQFTGGGLLGFGDPSLNGFVDDEVFSNRVKFSASTGSVGYRLGLRSHIQASGGAMFARRKSSLIDTNTYYASSSYGYRLNRSTEVGVGYSFATMSYPQRFGDNRIQGVTIQVGKRIRNRAGVNLSGGVGYFDSNFIGTVELDPELAESLGIPAAAEVQKAQRRFFAGSAMAFYNTDVVNFTFNAVRNVMPGNGILYAGVRDIVAFSLYRGFLTENRLGTALTGNFGRTSGLLQQQVQLRYQALASVNYRVLRGLSVFSSAGLRWQRLIAGGPFLPSRFATIGLGWSPEGMPLPF